MSPDFSGSVEEALDVVLREGHVSSEVVRGATEQELRQLLPLLLCARPLDDVLVALQERVRESRTLKLRLQLLHGHPALQSISCKRRFSSVAYEEAARRLQGRRPWAGGPSENESQDKGSKEGGEDGQVSFFVDMVDLQSEDFFKNAVFAEISQKKATFGHQVICHPFAQQLGDPALEVMPDPMDSDGPPEEEFDERDIAHVGVLKHAHNRAVLTLSRLTIAAQTLVNDDALEPHLPELLLRDDDSALRTAATQLLLRLFNAAWARPTRYFPDGATAPFCVAVDVVPTSEKQSLECGLRKGVPLPEFNFDYWRYTKGLNPVTADGFMRSAAGLYTAAFVCGLQDRNGEDVGVTNGVAVYLRTIRGVFEVPTVASWPRMTISKQMRDAFRELGVWDAFRDTCVRAYAVLRESYSDVFDVAFELFKSAGVPKERILGHLQTRHSLNLAERDRMQADAHFRKWLG